MAETLSIKPSKTTVLCHPCSKRSKRSDAVIYCADCDEVQCSVCAKDHETYVVMGHHTTVDINEWRKSNDFLDLAKISQCETHGLYYEFYCEHDSKLCCRECLSQFHHSCRNVSKISAIHHEIPTTETGSVDFKFRKLLEETERISVQYQENKDRFKSRVSTLPDNIDAMRKKVLETFTRFEEKIIEEAKMFEAAQVNAMDEIKRHTSEVASDIQNTLTNVKCLPQSMTPSQHFIFEKKMDEVMKDYKRRIEIQAASLRNLDKDISVQYSDKLKDFVLSSPADLGSIRTDQEEQGSDHLPEPNAVEFKHVTAVNPHSHHEHLNPLYTGMDFLQNDRLVLADNMNKKCVIMNTTLKVIGEQRLRYAPQNLYVFGNDELLISSGERQFIDFFEVNKENILIHIKRIHTLLPCDSMSVITDRTFAIGIASGDRPVCKLADFEHFSDFNVEFERERYKLGETKCVYCPRLEILVLTDKVTNTISLINTRTGEKTHVKDKVIKGPRCAVIGKDESIFVCCEGSCCLVQLSPYGEILSFRKLRMSFPYSVCISKDKSKIAVSNNCVDDCKLQIFSLV